MRSVVRVRRELAEARTGVYSTLTLAEVEGSIRGRKWRHVSDTIAHLTTETKQTEARRTSVVFGSVAVVRNACCRALRSRCLASAPVYYCPIVVLPIQSGFRHAEGEPAPARPACRAQCFPWLT